MAYHRNQRLHNAREAFLYNVVNPFAQVSRYAPTPGPTRPFTGTGAFQPRPTSTSFVTPQKAARPAQAPPIEPKNKTPKMNRVEEDEDMELAVNLSQAMGNALEPAAARESGSTGAKRGVKETPVVWRQQPRFGLPETVTQVLTVNNQFCMAVSRSNTNTRYQMRLTSTFDHAITNLATPTFSSAIQVGVFDRKFPHQLSNNWPADGVGVQWPTGTSVNTDGLQWRNWFHKMYQYYHVLGCEYEITMMNPVMGNNFGALVGTYIDTFSNENATNVHPTNVPLWRMEQWPDVEWKQVPSTPDGVSTQENIRTIRGRYWPQKVKQNVENDEDIKTWTKVGSIPSLNENLTIQLFCDPFSDASYAVVNFQIRVRYIVQYKDLYPAFRWPATQTAIAVTAPDDIRLN